ncbi:DUF1972 domain-containing protein [Thalassotalea sp. G20_0]|uniref:DUF1972 domain-containing protein n=1 Tax=Thalassotalea sp. G20_0 TaxID=2821093 RepID=UPI001AD9C21F|nr:DUF1972 domain-containing protein [Thalassotalea sp. G20_0]MBO9497168.1 DUF1972 domain-containing protein [Thalassotalea sp. G20_0]
MSLVNIIGTVGLPACYGGFETLVENLVNHRRNNTTYEVYCSSKTYKEKKATYKNATLHYIPFNANGVSSIIYDICSLIHAVFIRKSKTLLVLGVSGCIILPILRLFYKHKIITNIDGLEWKRDKWNTLAKSFLKLSEKLAVRYSDVVIADNQAIADYVKQEYGVDSVVIAYGGDHAVANVADRLSREPDEGYAFSLCRIEPENNVHIALEAFAQSGKPLKFVGNWNNSDYGKSLKLQYSDYSNIELIDPIYDVEQLFKLRARCSYYIHGHSAGGTNPSLVEIMHFAKPLIAFDCNYNRATTEDKAIYFRNAEELIAATDRLSATSGNPGAIMLEIAQRRYTWEIVANQYLDVICSK